MQDLYRKEVGQGSHQQDKNEISLEESKSSGDHGFSLAELWRFYWMGLLLGMRKTFLPIAEIVR